MVNIHRTIIMARQKTKLIQISKLLRLLSFFISLIFIVSIILAFTTLPFGGYHWLGTSKSVLKWEPEVIIQLGGGGMPSESNLMRSWYSAKAASQFPNCTVIIAMPGDINDSLSTPAKMKKELILRGVLKSNISFENKGTNTRAQALNCYKLLNSSTSILLITSPEHMRRSVLCFSKVGFKKINALPAFENAAEADLRFEGDKLGGNRLPIPDVGDNISLRYQVWSHLKYEIILFREFMAISYYKLRGWI